MARTMDLKTKVAAAADDPLVLQLPYGDYTVTTVRSRSLILTVNEGYQKVAELPDGDLDAELRLGVEVFAAAILEKDFAEKTLAEWDGDTLGYSQWLEIQNVILAELGIGLTGTVEDSPGED